MTALLRLIERTGASLDYQRVAERIATSLLGTIEHGASLSTCLVTDLTNHGARLRLSSTQPIPTRFTLRITRIDRVAAAQVRWRDGEEVGVAFELAGGRTPEAALI